jgi:hypothetical protein
LGWREELSAHRGDMALASAALLDPKAGEDGNQGAGAGDHEAKDIAARAHSRIRSSEGAARPSTREHKRTKT